MCGIAGIVHSQENRKVDPEILRRMNDTLVLRGPDDEGYWVHGPVGLAMRRLSIIDLEGGHQPIANETGEIWTVFNGEIYNFTELRQELIQKGHRFRTHTDTEVIVHLYEEEGEDFVKKLRGMFALALWDERVKKLLLFRDRLGIKPLHFWFKNGTLVFGSEIKAVLEYPEVSCELSISALSDYLGYLYIPAPKTIYRGIQKLEPAHGLRLQNGQLEIFSYWQLMYQPEKKISEREWCDRICSALEESVRMHRISDVPVGAFLSGGMDSSTIVAWMSRQNAGLVKTYSIGFSDSRFNELPYASEVARAFGTEHHETLVEVDAFGLLPKIITGFDEPFADSSAIPTYLVAEFARREVKVALSGDGGDELFGGYVWTQKEVWMEYYRRMPAFLKTRIKSMLLTKDYRPLRERGLLDLMRRFIYDAGLGPAESFGRRAMSFQPWMKQELFEPWVLEELKTEDPLARIRKFTGDGSAKSVIDKFLYLDSMIFLPDDLLAKVDRMSMMHSLEVRVPFLDHKLVELAARIPHTLKLRGSMTKYILKKAMRDKLPPVVLKQRKQGFAIPLQRWFRGKLSSLARTLLLDSGSLSRRYFRPPYVKWLLEEHSSGRQRFGTQLHALVVFELWNRLKQESTGLPRPELLQLKDWI